MPRVPDYESRVNDVNLPQARFQQAPNVELFGGGRANTSIEAAGDLGMKVAKLFQEEVDRAQESQFQDGDRRAAELQTNLQIRASQLQGRDSGGAGALVDQEWKKGISEISKDLRGKALDAFNVAIGKRWDTLNKHVQLHIATQTERVDDEETKAYISAARNSAKANAFDDEALNDEKNRITHSVTAWANRKGILYDKDGSLSPVYKSRLIEELSATHREVINSRLALGKDQLAKEYFDIVKSSRELTAEDLSALEKAVETGSVLGEVQRKADEIMADKNVTMKQAFEKAKGLEPRVRKELEQELSHRFALQEKFKQQEQEQLMDRAEPYIKELKMPPAHILSRMTPAQRDSVNQQIEKLAKGVDLTDEDTYYELTTLASSPETREQFLRTDLREYKGKLSRSDFQEIAQLQAGLRRGDEKTLQHLDGFQSKNDIVNDVMQGIGINPSPKSKTSDEAIRGNEFRRVVDREVQLWQQQTGKKATNEDVRKIADGLAIQIVTKPGFIWDTKKPLFEVQAKDIPKADRAKIEQALRKKGQPVTDDNVLRVFKAAKVKSGR